MARRLGMGVGAMLALVALAPATAAASNKATVEIDEVAAADEQLPFPATFYGSVHADKKKCGKGRKITLFERTNSGNEKFPASDTSEQTQPGVYQWDINGMAQDGSTYFAKMKKKGKCKKGVSEDFDYPDDNPMWRAGAKARVVLTINAWDPEGLGIGAWRGRVKSIKTKCMKDAEVTLYYSTGEDNAAVGDADIEKENGKFFWEVVSGVPADGEYFALAKPSNACKRAESPGFDYPKGRQARKAATKAKVKIDHWEGPPKQVGGDGTWYGTVKSDKNSCRLDRKVTLIYKDPAGSNLKVGTDRTENASGKYVWDINEETPSEGPYVAKVGKDPGCAKAKSKNFDYPEDNEPF